MAVKGTHAALTTTLILKILRHALHDPSGFARFRNRWMLQGTLRSLLNEHYHIPDVLEFNEDNVGWALGGQSQKLLNKHGFGTLNSTHFQYNTCGVFKVLYDL